MRRVNCFICPHCGAQNVTFSGIVASVEVRSKTDLVVPFTCRDSHVFFIPLENAADVFTDNS